MFTSRDAELAQRLAQQRQPVARLLGRAQVGLGDHLGERRAAAVEVHDARLGAVDAARLRRRARASPRPPRGGSGAAARPRAGRPCTAARRTGRSGSPWAGRDRSSSCGGRATAGRAREPSARPMSSPRWTARALMTGSAPGSPRQTGQVRVFGGSPNVSSQPQNIFVRGDELDVDLQPDDGLPAHPVTAAGRAVEADRLLERVGGVEQAVLRERRAGELEAGRQPLAQAVGDRDRRDAGERHRHGADVVEVHRERVVELGAEREGDARARRRHDEVEVLERGAEVVARSACGPSARGRSRRRSSPRRARRCRA